MRTKLAFVAGVAALLLQAASASAQVSVTATAGDPGPTAYTTLGLAFAAINAGIPQGDITIDIQANTAEAGPAILNSNGAGTAAYTSVLIRPTTDAVSISGTTTTGRGLIELNGADNVTINGDNPNTGGTNRDLTIQNTAGNTITYTSVVRVALGTTVTSANNNTVTNTVILGSATGRNIAAATSTTGSEFTTYGILVGGGATGATTAPGAIASVTTVIGAGFTATSFTVNNNRIDSCARAIAVQGSATSVADLLSVTNNLIGSATPANTTTVYARAMTLQGFNNTTISGNTVQNIEAFVGTQIGGIWLGDASATGINATVEKNNVTNVFNQNPVTFGAYGININAGITQTVRNNFVSNVRHVMTGGAAFSTTFGVFGIRVSAGTGHKVYHNSVNLFGPYVGTPASSLLSAAFAITSTTLTGMDVRNNAFANTITGGTTSIAHVAVYLPTSGTSAMNLTLNNNAYFTGSTAGVHGLAHVGTVYTAVPAGPPTFAGLYLAGNFNPCTTTPTTNFRAYSSILTVAGTNDTASFATTSAAPYTSTSDLHIPGGTATQLESGGVGTAITGVTTDIDNDPRNATTPDIGADEFAGTAPTANDIAATTIVFPPSGSAVGNGTSVSPQASFQNVGAVTQSGVSVQFDITGPGGYSYTNGQTIATICPGQSITVTFAATPTFTTNGIYNTTAATITPDANPANDQVAGTFEVRDQVSAGPHTVPGDFPSLTNPGGIFSELNAVGATGNITINVTADLPGETGTHALNQLNGGFTVTIVPSGAPRTISGTSVGSGLIKLNGADGVTIDGSLVGGTDRSLTITNGNAGATVIWIASASASNGANNNTVKNCIISGNPGVTAIAGVLAGSGTTLGGDAEAPNSNNTLQNNQIFRVQNSAYLRGGPGALVDQNWLVTGNAFGSTVPADKMIFRGMLVGNSQSFVISNNTINGVVSTTTSTATMSGIQVALAINGGSIFGNRISDIHQINTGGWGANGIFLAATTTASNVSAYNNFIWDVTGFGFAGVAQSDNGYGIMVNTGGGYNVRYNTVSMGTNQTAAGSITAAINIASAVTTAGTLDLRDNIFANTQTVGTRYSIYDASTAAIFGTINYNDYFSSQNVGFLTSARVTLADWQAATGQDGSSKAVDPVLVSGTDLHLQPTTPLAGQATPIVGITTDIDGDPRDPAVPDIGADEQPHADLSVTKTDSPDPVVAGTNITYTITVANAGPVNAANVSLADTLPAGTTFVSLAAPGGWGCVTPPVGSPGTVTCTNPSLAVGSAPFTLVVAVDRSVPDGTVITNTATVTAGTADPNHGNDSGIATTTVATAADLSVTKSDSPDPVTVGGNLTYTITATNAGPSNAATVSLNDTLPPGTTFVSLAAPGGWGCVTPPVGSPGTVTCTNPSFAIGSPAFTLIVAVGAAVPPGTVLTNTATATSATADPNPGNESGTTTTTVVGLANVGLSMTVDNPNPPIPSNVTFTITAINNGPSPATNVQITDLLPPGLNFVSATPSIGTYDPVTGVWNIGPFSAPPKTSDVKGAPQTPTADSGAAKGPAGNGGFATLSLVATVLRPEAIVNQATKTAQGEADPNASNNAALVVLNGPSVADLQVQKTVDNPTPALGTNVTFTVSATNAGPATATGVVLTDQLPGSLTFVSATPSQGSYDSGTGVWTVGSIANGATATLQIVATVNSVGSVSNIASKTAQVEPDYAAGNDAASVTLNDLSVADLSLGKTASQEPVADGTTFRYTIVIANYGPAVATGVLVTDGLPAGVNLVSATPSQGTCSGTTSISCPLGTVAPGGSAQVSLVVTKTVGGQISNLASVTGIEADPNIANNSNTSDTTPVELLNIEIE